MDIERLRALVAQHHERMGRRRGCLHVIYVRPGGVLRFGAHSTRAREHDALYGGDIVGYYLSTVALEDLFEDVLAVAREKGFLE